MRQFHGVAQFLWGDMSRQSDDKFAPGERRLVFEQDESGYRYSLDPFLLARFCHGVIAAEVVDLGTGIGVIPLLLAERKTGHFTGVELQPRLAAIARRNIVLNQLQDRIEILEADLREHRQLFSPQSIDLVVSNPPYRPLGEGKVAPDPERAAARHELAGGLEEFADAAAYLLRQGGRFCLIYLAERLTHLLTVLAASKLEPKRLRLVHSRPGDPARLVLVEARRNGRPGLQVEAPLYIYDGDGYSAELLGCYDGIPPAES